MRNLAAKFGKILTYANFLYRKVKKHGYWGRTNNKLQIISDIRKYFCKLHKKATRRWLSKCVRRDYLPPSTHHLSSTSTSDSLSFFSEPSPYLRM